MGKYIGPKTKMARKIGVPIFGPDKHFERKKYPPGQQGINKKRRRISEYGEQLLEKQKAKYTYGIREKQFLNYFKKASKREGITGQVLLQMLEQRLDNVIYRLGIAPTRAAARQLVSHKHVTVNQKVVDVPSFLVKPGDLVGVREKSKSLETISASLQKAKRNQYSWIEWDDNQMIGKFLHVPERSEIPEPVREQLIVELYSK